MGIISVTDVLMPEDVQMFGDIDKSLKPYHPNIYLAKPDRTIISKLHEAYNIKITYNLNGINTINFKIPYQINKQQQSEENEHIKNIRGHYLLRVDNEWFVIINTPSYSNDEAMVVEAKSLPYQLRHKRIASYEGENTASEILNLCLTDTGWSVGYVDSEYELASRDFAVEEVTKLQFLYEIAETYDAVLQFNTELMTVGLKKLDDIGSDKGLIIKYGKYLKDIEKKVKFDDVCTRLYVYGKDDLSIKSVNPAGTDYIEDFSYYMYPYKEDDNGNVIAHSNYMSDELCQAIKAYQDFCKSDPTLTGYLVILQDDKNNLASLKDDLKNTNDSLQSELDDLATYITANNSEEVDRLLASIKTLEDDIKALEESIDILTESTEAMKIKLSPEDVDYTFINTYIADEKEKILTADLLTELDAFVLEKKWYDFHYTSEAELFTRGMAELGRLAQPQIAYRIDMVDFLKVVECQKDWDKLNLGDTVTIEYEQFDISIKAKIIKINHNIDSNSIFVEIANTKDIKDGFTQWVDLIKKTASASTVVASNKSKWNASIGAKDALEQYKTSIINANVQAINAGTNTSENNVVIDKRGITITDDISDTSLRILNNLIAFTKASPAPGEEALEYFITPTGIVAERIVGTLIAGGALDIVSEDGTSFKVNQSGVTIAGSALTITNGLPTSELADGVILEGSNYNGVVIDTANGLVIERSDNKVRTTLNATEGFKIESSNDGVNWSNQLYADVNGNLVLSGNINMTAGSISWGSVSAPSYGYITGSKPPSDANNTLDWLTGGSNRGFSYDPAKDELTLLADNIATGTLTVNNQMVVKNKDGYVVFDSKGNISNDVLRVTRIYDGDGVSNNYIEIGDGNDESNYFDLKMCRDNNIIFEVFDDLPLMSIKSYGNTIIVYDAFNSIVEPKGNWDFTNVNVEFDSSKVTGLNISSVAKFG